ncbi:MAG: rod-binding protein [Pseudomonadota bacterium]
MSEILGPPTPFSRAELRSDATAPLPRDEQRELQLRAAAQELEAAFLSEMLKQARFGEARGAFGGGVGEEQFASFLRDEHARAITANGGIGLSEQIFNALVARTEGEV